MPHCFACSGKKRIGNISVGETLIPIQNYSGYSGSSGLEGSFSLPLFLREEESDTNVVM